MLHGHVHWYTGFKGEWGTAQFAPALHVELPDTGQIQKLLLRFLQVRLYAHLNKDVPDTIYIVPLVWSTVVDSYMQLYLIVALVKRDSPGMRCKLLLPAEISMASGASQVGLIIPDSINHLKHLMYSRQSTVRNWFCGLCVVWTITEQMLLIQELQEPDQSRVQLQRAFIRISCWTVAGLRMRWWGQSSHLVPLHNYNLSVTKSHPSSERWVSSPTLSQSVTRHWEAGRGGAEISCFT